MSMLECMRVSSLVAMLVEASAMPSLSAADQHAVLWLRSHVKPAALVHGQYKGVHLTGVALLHGLQSQVVFMVRRMG